MRPLPSLASRAHHRTRPWARAQWLRVPPPEASLGGGRRGLRPPHWPVRAFTVTECAARAFRSVMPTALGDKSPRGAVTGRVRPDAARMRWQGHRMEERTGIGVPSQGAHPSRPRTPPPTSTPPRTPTPLFVVAGTAKALTSACCGGGVGGTVVSVGETSVSRTAARDRSQPPPPSRRGGARRAHPSPAA